MKLNMHELQLGAGVFLSAMLAQLALSAGAVNMDVLRSAIVAGAAAVVHKFLPNS